MSSVKTFHLFIESVRDERRRQTGGTDLSMTVERADWKPIEEFDLMNFSTRGLTSKREAEETMSETWNCPNGWGEGKRRANLGENLMVVVCSDVGDGQTTSNVDGAIIRRGGVELVKDTVDKLRMVQATNEPSM
jgi:hypothetical protein